MAAAIFSSLTILDDKTHSGTGGVLWGGTKAGLSLLDYISHSGGSEAWNPSNSIGASGLVGRRVLSLGCGLGALELVCACLGASVCASDLPEVAPLFSRNLLGNAPLLQRRAGEVGGGSLCFEVLDWCSGELPPAIAQHAPFDYVLASDCVYWPELFQPLLNTMLALSEAQATPPHFFLLIEPRTPRELLFFEKLSAAGFSYSKIDERHAPCLAGAVSSASCIVWCYKEK
jgi:hypothetical protein